MSFHGESLGFPESDAAGASSSRVFTHLTSIYILAIGYFELVPTAKD